MKTYLVGSASAVVTLIGFWVINAVVRLQVVLRRIAKGKRATAWPRFAVLLAISVLASFVIEWRHVPHELPTRIFVLTSLVLLTWKHFSQDIDIATKVTNEVERWAMLALCAAAFYFPLAILPWLFLVLHSFRGWTHHGTTALRALMMFLAYALFVILPSRVLPGIDVNSPQIAQTFWFLALTCHVSHYVVPAIAKMELGRHPLAWALENRLHMVAAGSYSWGWARFLRPQTVTSILRRIRPFDRVLQVLTLVFEFGVIFALFHPVFLCVWLIGLCLMHFGIFLSTGILFWEWVIANVSIVFALAQFDTSRLPVLFSWQTGIACIALILVFPCRNKLWKPMRLAWWDTPFTARIHWDVIGASGKRYGLYNDFLCPHERLFGRVHGYFLVDEPIVTYHLGEVYERALSPHHKSSKLPFEPYVDHELRDLVIASRGEPAAIAQLKQRFGAVLRDEKLEREHVRWMRRFLRAFNKGKRKFVFPRGLRWLKAPGGQYYYWGDLERFRGQEKVMQLVLRYREEFFDGERFAVLMDREIRRVPIRRARRRREPSLARS